MYKGRSEFSTPSSPPPLLPAAAGAPALRALLTASVLIIVPNYSLLALSDLLFAVVLRFTSRQVLFHSLPGRLVPSWEALESSVVIFGYTAPLVERWGAKRVFQV
jgi:hypothetical protein